MASRLRKRVEDHLVLVIGAARLARLLVGEDHQRLARDQFAQELGQQAIARHFGEQHVKLARQADHLGRIAPGLGGGFLRDVLRKCGLLLRFECPCDDAHDRVLDRAARDEILARFLG